MLLFNNILKYNMFIIVLFKNGMLFQCESGLVNGPTPVFWLPHPTLSPALRICLPV